MTTPRFRDPDRDRARRRGGDGSPDRSPPRDRDGGDPTHPSFLALDRAALGSRTDHVSRHLAGCERCRAHVQRIAEPGPAPATARARPQLLRPAARGWPARRAWLGGLTVAAAAAIVLVALIGRHQGERVAQSDPPPATGDERFDTAKGGRAVGVYILRGRHTFLWNGSESIAPGDTLRLKLVPDGMSQVHVFSGGGGARGVGEPQLLHRADLAPDRDVLLDTAWRVDETGEREVLVVVLSRTKISLAAAQAAARTTRTGESRSTAALMSDDVWVARLVLPKRPTGNNAP